MREHLIVDIYRRLYGSERKYISEVLKQIEGAFNEDKAPLVFFEAPTGYGKTAIAQVLSLYSLLNSEHFYKVIHVLPMRTIIDDVIKKTRALFREFFGLGEKEDNLLTAFVAGQSMDHDDVFFLDAPYTVTTFDTFLMSSMKLNPKMMSRIDRELSYGYDYYTLGSICSSFIIFDEVQYVLDYAITGERLDEYSLPKIFMGVISYLIESNVPLIFMSATMPNVFVEYVVKKVLKGNKTQYEQIVMTHHDKKFSPEYDNDRPSGKAIVEKNSFISEKEVLEIAKEHIESSRKVLIVRNSPKRAIATFRELKEMGYRGVLIHGKLTPEDRKNSLEAFKDAQFMVSTQVVEAGVDISANTLITDPAPISSIIQRAGRIARYDRGEEGAVFIVKDGFYLPYNEGIVKLSLKILVDAITKGNVDLHSYDDTKNLIERIYSEEKTQGMLKRVVPLPAVGKIITFPNIRSSDVRNKMISEFLSKRSFIRELLLPCYVVPDNISSDPKKIAEYILNKASTENTLSISMRELRQLAQNRGGIYILKYRIHEEKDKRKDLEMIPIENISERIIQWDRAFIRDLIVGNMVILIKENDYIQGSGPRWIQDDRA